MASGISLTPPLLTSTLSSGLASGSASPKRGDTPEKIHDAAVQFEALLLAQMLRSVREASSKSGQGGEDASGSSMMEVAEQRFAQVLARNGGLGLAKLIVEGLSRK